MPSSPLPPIKALILDMDGVLWRGDQAIGDLASIFRSLHQHGLRVVLATNNATQTVTDYQSKLRRFGVMVEEWQIVNSSQAAAHYLKSRFPEGGNIYVVGEAGLKDTLSSQGFEQADQNVVAVVVGLDRTLTYEKLLRATLLIRDGALFIGTNPDRSLPLPEGLGPGAGAILAALEAATGVSPVVIGKPAPEMYRVALERLGTQPQETMVVGDRLETDIAGAQAIGCWTALVLTGVSTVEAAHAWKPEPDWIEANLAGVIERL